MVIAPLLCTHYLHFVRVCQAGQCSLSCKTVVEGNGLSRRSQSIGIGAGFSEVFMLSFQSFQVRSARYHRILFRKPHCLWLRSARGAMDVPESGRIRQLYLLDHPLHCDRCCSTKTTPISKCERCGVLLHVWDCLYTLCCWVERRLFLARRRCGPFWRPVRMDGIPRRVDCNGSYYCHRIRCRE